LTSIDNKLKVAERFEIVRIFHLLKTFPAFVESDGSLRCLHEFRHGFLLSVGLSPVGSSTPHFFKLNHHRRRL